MDKVALKISETELLERIRNADEGAFSLLYKNYSTALYGIIYRILKDEDEAMDLLQEAFVKIWKNIMHYDQSRGRLFTWMSNLTRNLTIDRIRSADYKNHERQNYVRDNSIAAIDGFKHNQINTDIIGLKGSIAFLSDEHQYIINKVYFEGFTQADLADELNIPLGTLKTRLRAAISELRKNFI